MINGKDFEKIEIRCGTVIEVHDFVKARKPAWKLRIDFGEYGIKQSSAQITDLYSKENLIGRQILAVTNLPPKQIANFFSECLVLGLSDANEDIVLLKPDQEVKNGVRVH